MSITKAHLPRLKAALQSNEWFAHCRDGFQFGLIELAAVKNLADGELLYGAHEVPDGIYCILSGGLRIHHVGRGRPVLLLDYISYEWVGELPLIDEAPDKVTATALGETSLMHVPGALLAPWLEQNPIYWRDFARLVCRRFRYGVRMLLHATSLSLEDRIIHRLHLISTAYGMRGVPASRIRCSQDELASMLGASRPSVTGALSKLAQQGLVELHYGEIHLLKPGPYTGQAREAPVPQPAVSVKSARSLKRRPSRNFDRAHASSDGAGPHGQIA